MFYFNNLLKIVVAWLVFNDQVLASAFTQGEVDILADALKESHDRSEVEQIFADGSVKKIDGMVKINITKPIKLSIRKYQHFTDSYAMGLARKFSRKWRTVLSQTQRKFKVDKEVIVAILLVETSFGRFSGNYQLISIFPSIFVDSWQFTNSSQFQQIEPKLKKRFLRKQNWALKEFQALLKVKEKFPKLGILKMKASYAGAFGKAQFLPSSYLNHAVAYNKKRTPNLHYEPDAIASIANYLVNHGYQGGPSTDASYKAIFSYNRSDVYVKTVLRVASKLNNTLARADSPKK